MKDLAHIGSDEIVTILIIHVKNLLTRARAEELRKFKITPSQEHALNYIELLGNKATPAEITRYMSREQPSVFGVLSRMEKQGLITRTQHKTRKHQIVLHVTEKGKQTLEDLAKKGGYQEILSVLSEEEKASLIKMLEKTQKKAFKHLNLNYNPPTLSLLRGKKTDSTEA